MEWPYVCPPSVWDSWGSSIRLPNDRRWYISAPGESQVPGKNSSWLGANVWPHFLVKYSKDILKELKGVLESGATVCLWRKSLILARPFPLLFSLLSLCRTDASSSLSSSRLCQWLLGGPWMRSWDVRRCTLHNYFLTFKWQDVCFTVTQCIWKRTLSQLTEYSQDTAASCEPGVVTQCADSLFKL